MWEGMFSKCLYAGAVTLLTQILSDSLTLVILDFRDLAAGAFSLRGCLENQHFIFLPLTVNGLSTFSPYFYSDRPVVCGRCSLHLSILSSSTR